MTSKIQVQSFIYIKLLYFSIITIIGVPAHAVGKEVGEMLLNQLYHGGCVDDFLQDQVMTQSDSFVAYIQEVVL